jgi:branched-chain amino acid transport system ATP-binding protein
MEEVAMNRLELQAVNMRFGALHVTRDVSFSIAAGERVALIGPNGAGKTTLVNIIAGALKHSSGSIHVEGRDVAALSTAQRARLGLIRTFQISRLFQGLSVEENLRVAALHRPGGDKLSRTAIDAQVHAGLDKLQITHLARKAVDSLSLGEKRLVELSLALLMEPRLLLLDEPAAGIPRGESRMVLKAVNELPADLAVMLIEHDMDLVFSWAKRIIVLAGGAVIKDGAPQDIAQDEHVRSIYFGRGEA